MPPQVSLPVELRGRPFRLADAVAAGLTARMLEGKRFRRIRHGVYAEASLPDGLRTQVDALRLQLPSSAVLSHQTAAELRGLPLPPSPRLHVTLPPDLLASRAAGVCCHRAVVTPDLVDGRQLTTPVENFVELAEHLRLVDLVVLGDALVRRRLATCGQLVHAANRTARRRGRRLAARAARLVRDRVDSPQETRARLLLVLAGLPEPVPGFRIFDQDGGWLGQVDLAYPELKIAIEYHGDVHRTRRGRCRSDVANAELLRDHGWTVIILTAGDLDDRPERTLDRISAVLKAAGHGSIPASYRTEWREHVPPRSTDRAVWPARDSA